MMAITRYEPWNLLNEFQREINSAFGRRYGLTRGERDTEVVTSDWVPAVDVKEEENRFVIYVDVPGVEAGDIEVTMEKGVLSIRGERKSENIDEQEGYKRIERSRGSFYRSFALPDTADAEGITARGQNGVLEVVIPKKAQVQARRISVES
jgi:HSP20 family protein